MSGGRVSKGNMSSGGSALGDSALIKAVSNHVTEWIGPVAFVFHEHASKSVHIDVHYVSPTTGCPLQVLVTSGMSERPMSGPDGEPVYAEMVALLPDGWPLLGPALTDERNYWPMRMIKDIARYPHRRSTWVGYGHSLSDSEKGSLPFARNTRLNSVILLPPISLPEEFHVLDAPKQRHIHFWAAVPLYQEELELKLRSGTGALLAAFNRHGVRDWIDPRRVNVVLGEQSLRFRDPSSQLH